MVADEGCWLDPFHVVSFVWVNTGLCTALWSVYQSKSSKMREPGASCIVFKTQSQKSCSVTSFHWLEKSEASPGLKGKKTDYNSFQGFKVLERHMELKILLWPFLEITVSHTIFYYHYLNIACFKKIIHAMGKIKIRQGMG